MSDRVCKNCNQSVDNKFCPQCGQKTSTERFTFSQLTHELIHGFFHIEHGLLHTAKELALRPGQMLRGYLAGNRVRYFNPFTFILLMGGISAFLLPKVHWHSFFVDLGVLNKNSVDQEVWNSSIKHFSLRLLLSIPLYAFVTKCFYYNKGLNFYEHIIVNTYLRAEVNFFIVMMAVLEIFIRTGPGLTVFKSVLMIFALVYVSWAYAGLFNQRITLPAMIRGFLAALVAALLEMVLLNLLISKTIL